MRLRVWVKLLALVVVTLAVMAPRPYNGGRPWQISATLLTGTPVAISSMAGQPPTANSDILICAGDAHKASAAGTETITITSGDGDNAWPSVPIFLGAAGNSAKSVLWAASSTTACEWMPGGASVSASGSGIYFKASGIY